jgi:hypothetical protein
MNDFYKQHLLAEIAYFQNQSQSDPPAVKTGRNPTTGQYLIKTIRGGGKIPTKQISPKSFPHNVIIPSIVIRKNPWIDF